MTAPREKASEQTAIDELARDEYEPLLPVEIRLIVISLVLGIVLLVVLFALSSAVAS